MKKLGKLKALWLCWELWNWLAKNPDKEKMHWAKYNKYRDGGFMPSSCFACAFTCCIIPCFKGDCCRNDDTAFTRWCDDKNRSANARIIANSAYKEYKRLGGKKVK